MYQSQNYYQKLNNGETIAYSVVNPEQVQTLLLIHGNLSDKTSWNYFVKELSQYPFKIIAIDQRGFGDSSYNNKIEKVGDLSADLKEFCEILQLQDLIICGWSLGGVVTLQFVAENPHLVKRAVLIASGHVEGFPLLVIDNSQSGESQKNEKGEHMRRVKTLEEVNSHPKIQYFQQILQKQDKQLLKSLCGMTLFNGVYQPTQESEEFDLFTSGSLKQQNYTEIAYALCNFNITNTNLLEKITCPVLIYHGAKDLVIPQEQALSNAEHIGKNKCKVIIKEEVGHCPPFDCPQELALEINQFSQENLL